MFTIVGFAETVNIGYLKGSTLVDVYSDTLYGSEVDLIRNSINGTHLNYIEYINAVSLLKATTTGEIDCGIGGISMTPDRIMEYDFSLPTSINNITACYDLTHTDNTVKLNGKIYEVIKERLIQLFKILTVFALVIWVIERYNNDDSNFHKNFFKGIADGYWWGLVTSSTVGYGDLVPKTLVGRFIASLVIIVGVTWFGLYVGSIGGAYAEIAEGGSMVVGIDLHKPITKSGSTACIILDDLNIDYISFETLDECIEALSDNKGDCVVFDENKLEKYTTQDETLEMTGQIFRQEYVAMVFGENFKYGDMVNKAIVIRFHKKIKGD